MDNELISRVVAAISSSVMSQQLERAQSQALPTLDGYTLLLGSVALMHRTAFSEFDRARAMLEHLIDRSRRHPIPYAWLAKWHVLRVQQGWAENPEKEKQLALDCTKRALDIDPTSSLALTIDGFVHTNLLKNLEVAAQRYEAALSVNPNESLAWLLTGTLNAFRGDGGAAFDASERALRLSPLDPIRYFYDSLAASAAVSAAQYERAIELALRSLRSNKTHTSTYRALAIAQAMSGKLEAASATVTSLLNLEPTFTVSKFRERSPSSEYPIGEAYANALKLAGLPE